MAANRTRLYSLRGPLLLRYSLSLRDVAELVVERGLYADYTTAWNWVQRYGPESRGDHFSSSGVSRQLDFYPPSGWRIIQDVAAAASSIPT